MVSYHCPAYYIPMKTPFYFLAITAIISISCERKEAGEPDDSSFLQGTWELLSETKIENGDTTFTPASKDQRMIKIINETHFAFLRHDLNGGKDSTAMFVAGGGKYSLNGNAYHEELEYCNFREWENHNFDFHVSVETDTLTQQGSEKVEGAGIDRIIIEKYRRVSE